MKLVLLTLIAIALSFNGTSQESEEQAGIQFMAGTWAEIVEIARKENKPIFVDAYTTWCGPCKWMAKNTFTDTGVGSFMNDNFIAYKMDMEKGEGIEFAEKNNVRAYPTLLYFDSNGEFIHRSAGAANPERFIETGQTALDPTERFATLQKKYERGNSDKEFLLKYINKSNMAGVSLDEPFEKYWSLISEDEKITKENLVLMSVITGRFSDMEHELFVFMNTNKARYIKEIGADEFEPYWKQAYRSAIWHAAKEEKASDKKARLKKAKAVFEDRRNEIDAFYQLNIAWQARDDEMISEAENVYVDVTTDFNFLNSKAWDVYEKSDDPEELEKALVWVNRSVELNAHYANVDTKGAVLYKLKRYKDAVKALEESIELADDTVPENSLEATRALIEKAISEM